MKFQHWKAFGVSLIQSAPIKENLNATFHCIAQDALTNFRSSNQNSIYQHWPTFNQDQLHDNQHQDNFFNIAIKHRDKQTKGYIGNPE